jgi:hypothetical protein
MRTTEATILARKLYFQGAEKGLKEHVHTQHANSYRDYRYRQKHRRLQIINKRLMF